MRMSGVWQGWEGVKRHFLKEVPQPMRAWLLERMRPKVRSAMTIQVRHILHVLLSVLQMAFYYCCANS